MECDSLRDMVEELYDDSFGEPERVSWPFAAFLEERCLFVYVCAGVCYLLRACAVLLFLFLGVPVASSRGLSEGCCFGRWAGRWSSIHVCNPQR